MPSVNIIYYTHKVNSDGSSPVVIQIIDGQPKKRTLANVFKHQWNEDALRVKPKTHPNYAAINILISDEYNRIEKLIINGEFDLKRDFIDYFDRKKKKPSKPMEKTTGLSFAEIGKLYIKSLNSGASMLTYESRINFFIELNQLGNLKASEITKEHIDKYVKWQRDKGNMDSTIRTNIKIIRFPASFAVKHEYDTMSPHLQTYPLPRAANAIKKKLTKEQVQVFKEVKIDLDKPKIKAKYEEVQDMFLLAIYLRGMRIGDVIQIKQADFKNGRYFYTSAKSETGFDIKLVPQAQEIVNKHLDGREYLFNWFKWIESPELSNQENKKSRAQHIKTITANINKILKQISKNNALSTHMAKHTFGKMTIDAVKDINKSMDMLGHTSMAAHQTYIRELSKTEELDNAADKIFE